MFAVLSASDAAASGAVRVDAVEAELVADRSAVVPGEPIRLGLRLAHDPHWHTYWRNPGDSGLPTRFDPALPDGFVAGPIEWPAPQRLLIPPLANYGYEGEIVLPRQVDVPSNVDGPTVTFSAHASWLVCREVCIPGEAQVSLELPVAASGSAPPARHAALFERAADRTPGAPIPVDYAVAPETVSIVLPPSLGSDVAVEFFPHLEGAIVAAAPQRVFRLDDGRRRLELALSDEWKAKPAADRNPPVDGIVVAAGASPLAISAGQPVDAAGGELVAVADGRVVQIPGARSTLGERLLGTARSDAVPAAGGPAVAAPSAPDTAAMALLPVLALAFVGGLILNLMPCVFPVIGLKILGFAGHGGAGSALDASARRRVRRGSGWFALGVMVAFWALATLLLALRASGAAAGWGFQLQSPVFVAAMGLLFVAIGLNLAGLYEVGAGLTRLGDADRPDERHPAWSSFASGLLAVLVATPCTAPLMGSALGYALTQSASVALAVFTALGAGMAAPYIVLGLFPGWLRRLPRPGRWMESLRQFLAFPMLAAAVWLGWVLGRQAGLDAVSLFALAAVVLAATLWAWGRFVQRGTSAAARRIATAAALGGLVIALATAWQGARLDSAPSGIARDDSADRVAAADWQPWSAATLEAARASGRPVFVDFTAAWCVSCQANKLMVLDRDDVRAEFARRGVVTLRADWTRQDPAITAELARFGRSGVPLYLVYGADADTPRILPEILTRRIVIDALDRG